MNPEISVVIPVFNEEENLVELHKRVAEVLKALGRTYEIIFVDDGSTDKSFEILRSLQHEDRTVRVVRFTRNFGQHPAVSAGFERSKGEVIVTLDADLQNPPEEIPKLLLKLDEGFDVAAGWRENRHDSWLRKVPSFFVNWMIAKMTGVRLKDYGCMLRAYRRNVIDHLNLCPELNRFLTALVSWLGVSIGEVKVRHDSRVGGSSKYSYFKLIRMNFDLITGFSIFPIQLVSLIGFLLSFAGFSVGIVLVGWRIAYGSGPGGTVIFLAFIFMLFGVQLFVTGLIGEYIGRIFIESQRRPYYVVRDELEAMAREVR